jgi:hypothetical protein
LVRNAATIHQLEILPESHFNPSLPHTVAYCASIWSRLTYTIVGRGDHVAGHLSYQKHIFGILFPFQSISQQMDAVDWVSISDVLARPQFSSLNKFDVCFKCNQSISHSSWSVLERVIREDLLSSIDTRGVLHVTFIMSQ